MIKMVHGGIYNLVINVKVSAQKSDSEVMKNWSGRKNKTKLKHCNC